MNTHGWTSLRLALGVTCLVAAPSLSQVTLVPCSQLASTQGRSYQVLAVDLDRDGDLEVVTTDFDNHRLLVYTNQGAGVFAAPQALVTTNAAGGGRNPFMLATADFNGDGAPDVAVTHPSYPGEISVWINNGRGVLGNPRYYPVADNPYYVTAEDVDGDAWPDLVVGNVAQYGNFPGLGILYNQGNGSFGAHQILTLGNRPICAAVADLDGDGLRDIAVSNWGGDYVQILWNLGARTFLLSPQIRVGNSPYGIQAADIDGDGVPDLVGTVTNLGSPGMWTLVNRGNRTFSAPPLYNTPYAPTYPLVCDLDGDGDLDIAISGHQSGEVILFENTGVGTFRPLPSLATSGTLWGIGAGDVDGDGDWDLIGVPHGLVPQVFCNVTPAAGCAPFGSGCFGSRGTAVLACQEPPRLGLRLGLRLERLVANQFALLFLGVSSQAWGTFPLPVDLTPIGATGCSLFVSGDFPFGLATGGFGTVGVSIPVPADQSLHGSSLFPQAVIIDPAVNAAGLVVTNPVHARLW